MRAHGPGRWFSFKGRARRREFLLQSLIILTINQIEYLLTLAAVDADIGGSAPALLFLLAAFLSFLASWAVVFRRVHDFGVPGRAVVIPTLCLGAIFGFIAWRTGWEPPTTLWLVTEVAADVVLFAIPGEPGPNRFGPPPGLPAPPAEVAA